jgi:hypothetical protein
VKLTPVTDAVLDAGFVIANDKVVDPPTVILDAPNDLVTTGGAVAAAFTVNDAIDVLPAP